MGIAYILKRLKTMDTKAMRETIKKVQKENGKSKLSILLDMQKCARTPEAAEQVRIGDVGFVRRVVQALVEDHLQLLHELPFPAHQPCQPLHVVRHIERVVPRRALVEARGRREVLARLRIEGA